MTLRLSDEDTETLRELAALEGRSMQAVARTALRQYFERVAHGARVSAVAHEGAVRYAEALRRLGES
ncbi:hypothetical protein BJF78_25775 [Pseudonocardia sp. CNS-139]|nr:hypothetical protein BJF78_25775 [Pseudonocardia sp. CNS-139]